jgi:hypothetical protein
VLENLALPSRSSRTMMTKSCGLMLVHMSLVWLTSIFRYLSDQVRPQARYVPERRKSSVDTESEDTEISKSPVSKVPAELAKHEAAQHKVSREMKRKREVDELE